MICIPYIRVDTQYAVGIQVFFSSCRWKLRHRIRVQVGTQHLPVFVLNEVFIGEQDAHQLVWIT